ncbi:speckle-type POZ protein-like [Cotesia glomerata]|uniref:speckle-type POZ protein-like n=1 Tax=Cotesia glomerata TaxID=32391 RepID=UPI001D00BBE4|nr:speckle-type POZ protein-like [Cotesia glomerata]
MEETNSRLAVKRSLTDVAKHTCYFEWRINGMSSYLENFHDDVYPDDEEVLHSAIFSTGSAVGDEWCHKMTVNDERFIETVIIELDSVGQFDCGVKIEFTLFILDNEYQKAKRVEFKKTFKSKDYFDFAIETSRSQLLENKNKLMPNDTLTVCAELTLFETNNSCFYDTMQIGPKRQRITDDYKDLYKKEQDTDVVIKVSDKIFKAHKAILMARSPDLFYTVHYLEGWKPRKSIHHS